MPFRRSRRTAESAADRLLDVAVGAQDPTADGVETREPVGRLLAAAAAPARPGELAGEEAALTAFRDARAQRPTPTPARRRSRVTVAAWAAGVVVIATAGAAVAAVGLDRSAPAPTPTRSVTDPPATSPGDPGDSGSPTSPGVPTTASDGAPTTAPAPSAPGHNDAGRPPHGPSTGPTSVPGLCVAYRARPADQRGKSLRTPMFRALVEAAGGPEHVDAYCAAQAPTATGRPTDRPSATSRPSRTPKEPKDRSGPGSSPSPSA
ncbi:hypothetical protein O7606_05605 [Micromonospora sp. WMMD882]|uniref:hypothetical protein n=1 Tax=Micromonospora sp. WMMD882 TaxID=3015151 RepID=UPI00248BB274|nr:hypothetical protein [Micromonospora sp. WMMD882]WBB80861.1 hypothetical protein O7606_05605 [Micromonospora sp. WMMD882]